MRRTSVDLPSPGLPRMKAEGLEMSRARWNQLIGSQHTVAWVSSWRPSGTPIMGEDAPAHPDRRRGKTMMGAIIDSLGRGVPTALAELAQLGRTLHRRRADILAYFDHQTSNGPTEAINGRLEALRRNALGFRNLTHYRWRSLLHSGALHSLVDAL